MRFAEWNPSKGDQFASYNIGRSSLELWNISASSSKDSVKANEQTRSTSHVDHREVSSVTCMEWNSLSSKSQIICGNQAGTVNLVDWTNPSAETIICSPPLKGGRKTCSSVSWNRHDANRIAAGFDLVKNEHCVAVWDLEHSSRSGVAPPPGSAATNNMLEGSLSPSSAGTGNPSPPGLQPILSLCFEEAIASLSFLPGQPHMLAVGTSMGWVRVFDTREDPKKAAQISLMAHPASRPRKVKGIRPDPFNEQYLCTFSDTQAESVKVWDLRRGTSSKSKLTPIYTIMPHDVSQRESAVVDAVWSNARENVVAVATSHQKSILFYNATKDVPEAVTRAPFHSLPVPESVKSLSWQRAAAGNEGGDSALSRLLIATNSGVADYQVVESVPLGYGSAGVATGSNQSICFTRPSEARSGSTEKCSRMKDRSAAGYSLDAGRNTQVLSEELDTLFFMRQQQQQQQQQSQSQQQHTQLPTLPTEEDDILMDHIFELARVWGWVARVELLHDDTLTLNNCGIRDMFTAHAASPEETEVLVYSLFGVRTYGSECRENTRLVCGWADLWDRSLAQLQLEKVGQGQGQGQGQSSVSIAPLENDEDDNKSVKSAAFSLSQASIGSLSLGLSNEGLEKGLAGGAGRVGGTVTITNGTAPTLGNSSIDSEEEERLISELESIVEDVELEDSFERAAALAVWHGHIELAVRVLQRNSDAYNKRKSRGARTMKDPQDDTSGEDAIFEHHTGIDNDNDNDNNKHSAHARDRGSGIHSAKGEDGDHDYYQLVSLTAMCFAGFPNRNGAEDVINSGKELWVHMCSHVLQQLEQVKRHAASYVLSRADAARTIHSKLSSLAQGGIGF